ADLAADAVRVAENNRGGEAEAGQFGRRSEHPGRLACPVADAGCTELMRQFSQVADACLDRWPIRSRHELPIPFAEVDKSCPRTRRRPPAPKANHTGELPVAGPRIAPRAVDASPPCGGVW